MSRNVLHLIDTGGPGGAETIFMELVTRLSSAGWNSHAVIPVDDWLSHALARRDAKYEVLRSNRSFDLGFLWHLLNRARGFRADLIHAHLFSSAVYGSLAGRLLRLPVVCTFHGQADVSGSAQMLRVKFNIIDRSRNHVTFVSDALRRDVLARSGLKRAGTSVIHNGIDLTEFTGRRDTSFRRELGLADDTFLIGAVGNVRPSKSYDVLLRMAAELKTSGIPFCVVVVGQTTGSGSLFGELVRLHAELRLGDAVRFVGFREDIARVLAALDVYVSSSCAEGFSLTTVQAMAAGLPVVATRSGGPEEIVEEGRTGRLVAVDSPSELAAAVLHFLRGDKLARETGARAREAARHRFGIDRMVSAYDRLYHDVTRA